MHFHITTHLCEIRYFTGVMISRTKAANRSSVGTDNSAFISAATAASLISNGAISYCLQILKSLLNYWKGYQLEDSSSHVLASSVMGINPPKGGLLKPHPLLVSPNMAPFFLRQYVRGHANDVFEAYPQLLTEMVLRLPYQIKKVVDSIASSSGSLPISSIPSPVFEQAWFFYLCEYMMTQQTPYVRKQVRRLLLYICESKERYRQRRDHYILESNMKEAKVRTVLTLLMS